MSRVDTTAKLTVSPSRLWAWFRPEKMKQWYGPELRVLSRGSLGKGAKVSLTGRSGAKEFGYEAVVTEYNENRTLAWEGADPKVAYRISFTLTPENEGTLLLLRDEFRLRGPIGWIIEKLFMSRRVARYDRHFLTTLKRLVEEG